MTGDDQIPNYQNIQTNYAQDFDLYIFTITM
jgi:hypothetical protein